MFAVHIVYSGTQLALTITDTVTQQKFTANFTVNISHHGRSQHRLRRLHRRNQLENRHAANRDLDVLVKLTPAR